MTDNDTPTLDEAFEEASAELTIEEVEETPEPIEEETSEEPKVEEPEEEKEESPEEEQTESFTKEPVNVEELPPEMKELYKNWERAYTTKRQAERAEIKALTEELEKFKTQAPPQQDVVQQQKPIDQMTQAEFQQHVIEVARQDAAIQKENAYIEAQEEAFFSIDPRLDENNPNFDEDLSFAVIGKLTSDRNKYEEENDSVLGFDFTGKAKELIESYDKKINGRMQEYIKKQSEISRTKSQKFSKSNPKTKSGSSTPNKFMDFEDAADLAWSER